MPQGYLPIRKYVTDIIIYFDVYDFWN